MVNLIDYTIEKKTTRIRSEKWNRVMGNGFTSFVDDVEGTVYDVVKLESIIGFREALYVQRIVLSKLWKYEILFCTFWGVYGKREISVGEGCTWWPTTATQTIMA